MTYRFLVRQRKTKEAKEILKKNPKLVMHYRLFYRGSKILNTYRKMINKILNSKISSKTKLLKIRELGLKMREIAEKINIIYAK